ncbi:hypothetical protein CYMTET_43099 [Cymbomonas tetramitiformis]|uniref:Uncharacterized protein n=1 Tax=Cymbomonas tetramitiformis TaxID=36881 RepID=A0AAE0BWQ1_9CHLO|nr:hypothetical protein CYMTET_47091 [Cymbomonas tetramitiformis]KAK3247401.1 hypothetical protein CYMTET_43099 [Cymbomonas tetramitiformis]
MSQPRTVIDDVLSSIPDLDLSAISGSNLEHSPGHHSPTDIPMRGTTTTLEYEQLHNDTSGVESPPIVATRESINSLLGPPRKRVDK